MHERSPRNRCWFATRPGIEAWSSNWSSDAPPKHSHDAYQISLTRAGLGSFLARGTRESCPVGRLAVIEPGEIHESLPAGLSPWKFDTLYLDQDVVLSLLGVRDCRRSLATPRQTGTRQVTSFTRLHRAIVAEAPALERDEALVALLHTFQGGGANRKLAQPSQAALQRVRGYLDACPVEDVSLDDLASLADLSPSHLSRSFRREFGVPPHSYLIQVRVSRARSLLKGGMPIIHVASQVGFADQAHLTRHFHRLVGITPGLYRAGSRIVQDGAMP